MTTYDFVHLVIHASGDQIAGRTKLQKTVYFVGVMSGMLPYLGYRPHFYGPFSPDVAEAVEDLRSLKFLKQEAQGMNAVDSRGFEVARYDYTLTGEGKQIAEEKAQQHSAVWKRITVAVKRLNAADASDYVKLSIAAKAYFMHGKSSRPTTPEELSKMGQQFGWKVSEQQLQEANEWLETLDLVETAPTT